MPYISEENDMDDFDIDVTLKSSDNSEHRTMKEIIRKDADGIIRKQIVQLLTEMRQGCGWINSTTGMKTKPDSKLKATKSTSYPTVINRKPNTNSKVHSSPSSSLSASTKPSTEKKGVKKKGALITKKVTFKASQEDIYSALMDPSKVSAYTRVCSTAKILQIALIILIYF